MSFNPFGTAKNNTIAFGDIAATYADALTACEGRYLEIKNACDQNLVIKAIGLNGSVIEKRLLANDIAPRIIPCSHYGAIQVKYESNAPTSGNLYIESFTDGV